ncbi:MAG: hypothetical protein QW430_12655 [Metallosphaera sp.]|uniref:hypothetical protein n=1 Tax=Metallosphaera sp. TaxID=2020860 RepID=UPI00316A366F
MALTVKRKVGVKSNVVVQRGYGLEEEEMFIPVLGKLTKVHIPKIKNVIEKKETHNQVNVQGLAQWLYTSWVYSSEANQYASHGANITPPNNTITLLNNGSAVTTLNANAYVILQQTLTGWVWLFIAIDNTTASYTANQIQLDISLLSLTFNGNVAYYVPIGTVPNFATANVSITKTSDTYISVSWFISFNITGLTQGTNAILVFAWSVYNLTPLGGSAPNAIVQNTIATTSWLGIDCSVMFGYVSPSGPSTSTLSNLTNLSLFSLYFDSNSAYLAMPGSVSVSSGTIINGFIISPPYFTYGGSSGVVWEIGTSNIISTVSYSTYYFIVPVPQFTVSTSGVLPYVITFVFTPQT